MSRTRPMRTRCHTVICIAAVVIVVCFCFAVMYTTTISVRRHSATLAYFTGHVVPIVKALNKTFSSQRSPSNYTNFAQAMTVRADADGYIILVMTDEAFIDMAINFYEVSLRAHQLDNFLFVGLGRTGCEIMRNMSIPCFHYADDSNVGATSDFGSREFNRKVNVRNRMIIEALEAKFTVIHSDADVAFITSPVQHLKEVMKQSDLAAMRDETVYNSGFIVVKPTAVNRRIYTMMQDISRKSPHLHDQDVLNIAIGMLHQKQIPTRVTYLDNRLYVDGVRYFEYTRPLLPSTDDPCSSVNKTKCSVLVVHNNWIVSKQAKRYRFREHFMWSYDGKDGYYTSQSRNYIMYTNPAPIPNMSQDLRNLQMSSLGTALALGYLLNRTVILPRFYCGTDAKPCPLNSHIRVTTFDKFFQGKYRESNFLQHPKVPEAVKQNMSHQPLISNATRLSSPSKQFTVDSNSVVSLFRGRKDRLINFGILEGIKITFSDNSTEKAFKQKVHKAFITSDYRQLRNGGHLWS